MGRCASGQQQPLRTGRCMLHALARRVVPARPSLLRTSSTTVVRSMSSPAAAAPSTALVEATEAFVRRELAGQDSSHDFWCVVGCCLISSVIVHRPSVQLPSFKPGFRFRESCWWAVPGTSQAARASPRLPGSKHTPRSHLTALGRPLWVLHSQTLPQARLTLAPGDVARLAHSHMLGRCD